MSDQAQIKNTTLRLHRGDITDFEIEAIVYYARNDLELGSGFGTAISVRGGPTIQEELRERGTLETMQAVVSAAGNMKTQHIVHAVGPKFQEEDTERKLKATIQNALQAAEEKGITAIAFPPMGAGFYGVPLETSADITMNTIVEYLEGETGIQEVVICLLDSREYKPFQERISRLGTTVKEAS